MLFGYPFLEMASPLQKSECQTETMTGSEYRKFDETNFNVRRRKWEPKERP